MLTAAHICQQFIAATSLWMFGVAVHAEDWPQWRGPNRDGVWSETGIAETFPAGGLNIRWRAPVGFGFSSPVVAQGRVYVTDSQLEPPKVRDRVLCFDEATGQPLWTYSSEASYPDWAFTPGQESSPCATPIVRDGRVYAPGSLSHRLYCLETANGHLLWQKDLAKEYGIEETASICSSPLIDGDFLILLIGGKPGACVVAFDRKSGKETWRSLDEAAAHSSPIIITAGGTRQLIVWTLQSVTALDPATGKPYWRERFPLGSSSVVATPVFSNNRVLISGLMLKLDADKPVMTVLWPEKLSQRVLNSTSTALLRDEFLYSLESSGDFVCREAGTGRQIWQTDKVTDRRNAASASVHLTVNGDSVLLFNDLGELIRARLDGEGYHEISRTVLIEPSHPSGGRKVTWAAPAFANGHAFARSNTEIVCASLQKTP